MILAQIVSLFDAVRVYWPVAVAAFVISLTATPICRAFAYRRRIVDRPDDFLKPHHKPIPYLGGVAICLGWSVGILVGVLDERIHMRTGVMIGILGCGVVIMLVGLFDDLRMARPAVKLALNIAVALGLVGLGIGTEVVRLITAWTDPALGLDDRWLELAYSIPIALFIIVGACNATNLIDGLDGLCSGVLGIISLGFLILAVHLHVAGSQTPLNPDRVVLAAAMLGASLGFLPYNRNPATIFMGDAGSMLLGLNAAVLILLFADQHIFRWAVGAVLVFGLPISDMILTLIRRWRNARPLMAGDRSHFYDQLIDRGFTVRQVVVISYALSAAFVLIGCSMIVIRTRYTPLVLGAVVLAVVWAVWRFQMVQLELPRPHSSDKQP